MAGAEWYPVSRTAAVLTANLPRVRERNRCRCDRCRGTGFDSFTAERASRKCPRCKGAGSTVVGSTKR